MVGGRSVKHTKIKGIVNSNFIQLEQLQAQIQQQQQQAKEAAKQPRPNQLASTYLRGIDSQLQANNQAGSSRNKSNPLAPNKAKTIANKPKLITGTFDIRQSQN